MKNLRNNLGLSQALMAAMLGMDKQSYARIERGERKPTKVHEATIDMVEYMLEKGVIREYITKVYMRHLREIETELNKIEARHGENTNKTI